MQSGPKEWIKETQLSLWGMANELKSLSNNRQPIVEDTVHCDLCGFPWVLGGIRDGIILTLPQCYDQTRPHVGKLGAQLKLCMDCAAHTARTFEQECQERDACEHGVTCGEWCAPCHGAYKKARLEQ